RPRRRDRLRPDQDWGAVAVGPRGQVQPAAAHRGGARRRRHLPGAQRVPLVTRASDAEREAVVARLRDAAGEGRLTVEELDERIDAAYAARTRDELDPLTADLPAAGPGASPAAVGEGMPVGAAGATAPSVVLGI